MWKWAHLSLKAINIQTLLHLIPSFCTIHKKQLFSAIKKSLLSQIRKNIYGKKNRCVSSAHAKKRWATKRINGGCLQVDDCFFFNKNFYNVPFLFSAQLGRNSDMSKFFNIEWVEKMKREAKATFRQN